MSTIETIKEIQNLISDRFIEEKIKHENAGVDLDAQNIETLLTIICTEIKLSRSDILSCYCTSVEMPDKSDFTYEIDIVFDKHPSVRLRMHSTYKHTYHQRFS